MTPAPQDWSIYASAFEEHGCPGSIIEGDQISGYVAHLPGALPVVDALKHELMRLGATSAAVTEVADQDWSELWKIHFKPRRIGERFVLRPTWEEAALNPGDIEIVLDPGQAFGTGDHPTTRLCLRLMELVEVKDRSVADIGCGSGVLAIAASLLGAKSVYASDLDPLSVEITSANMERNNVEFETGVAAGFDGLEGTVDVALSNIISATLIRLAADAHAHISPAGAWIVSGIIEGNWPDVAKAGESVGFRVEHVEQEDDWIGAVFRR